MSKIQGLEKVKQSSPNRITTNPFSHKSVNIFWSDLVKPPLHRSLGNLARMPPSSVQPVVAVVREKHCQDLCPWGPLTLEDNRPQLSASLYSRSWAFKALNREVHTFSSRGMDPVCSHPISDFLELFHSLGCGDNACRSSLLNSYYSLSYVSIMFFFNVIAASLSVQPFFCR